MPERPDRLRMGEANIEAAPRTSTLRSLRVLYLHFAGPFGGSSRSLFEAVNSFPPGAVQPAFVTQRGSASEFFRQLGDVIETVGMTQIDDTRYGYYRGLRWLVLLRRNWSTR